MRTAALAPPTVAPAPARRLRLPPAWSLYALILAYPLWWVVGISELGWILASIPMAAFLLSRRRIVAPRGFGIWLLFLMWMLLSGTQLGGGTSALVFAFRVTCYLSATVMFLYFVNVPEALVPTRRLVFLLAGFWVVLLVFGFLGLMFPRFTFRSLVELALPGLARIDYFRELVHPQLAEIQYFIGYTIARPSAPFFYTNYWGGNFGALVPIVLAALGMTRSMFGRWTILGLLALSVIPLIISVNRGVWLSVGAGLAYALVRFTLKGHVRAAMVALVALMLAVGLVLLTPLGETVADRLAHPDSNEGRLALIRGSIEGVKDSPILGHAVPQPSNVPGIPYIGTGGLFWQILYTTGIPGMVLFGWWLLRLLWTTGRGGSTLRFWAHVSILVITLQMPYYSMLPVELHVLMLAAAIAWRERAPAPAAVTQRERLVPRVAVVAR